ncbi:MAG: restriction endonuclease [Clostridia bacterium]|nr:restriction endonuclease [Clostridia bacterium]
MSIDFSTMDGYQFEVFVCDLFRKLGFEVETTNYSNDGGIDLVATYSQPIFSGKYIIQCKNWEGSVGQPEVRDLYGVVMDQRANKGILITPSDYTQQAYEFARNKNIELINGSILRVLIDKETSCSLSSQTSPKFHNDRYSYYQKNISEEPNNASNYLQMIEYLREYVKQQDDECCTIGLFDEIVDWTNKMISRCFKTSSKSADKSMALRILAEAYIHCGRLSDATEVLLKSEQFWIFGFDSQRYFINTDGNGYSYQRAMSWNLYAAFKHIGYDKGCNLLISKLRSSNGKLAEEYYHTGLLGNLFVYPRLRMTAIGAGKTKHLDVSEFFKKDLKDPSYFYDKFYTLSNDEYAKKIDEVLKLHGIL